MKETIYLFFYLFTFHSIFGQQDIVNKFLFGSHTYNGLTIPYRLFVPENYDSSRSYPLVLCLHGSGEVGTDNKIQVEKNYLATSWANPKNQNKNECFVLVPQCPSNDSWITFNNSSWNIHTEINPITKPLAAANDAINAISKEYNIDQNRLYITGLSLGGYGTWDLVTRYPDRFAAAVPLCGGGDPDNSFKILNLPIWNFHGRLDNVVTVSHSREVISKLESFGRDVLYTDSKLNEFPLLTDSVIYGHINSGANLIYTEYKNGFHDIWTNAYNDSLLFDWVFRQYKIPDGISLINMNNHKIISGQSTVQWNTTKPGSTVDLYYSSDAGESWQVVAKRIPDTGSYEWNTEGHQDSYAGKLSISIRDSNNAQFSFNTSGLFTLNNTMNGKPYVKFMNEELLNNGTITEHLYQLKLLAGDPDNDSIAVDLYYSEDNGVTYHHFSWFMVANDTAIQETEINLGQLHNSYNAVLKAVISDGINSWTDITPVFGKITIRDILPENNISYVSKFFDVPFNVNLTYNTVYSGDHILLTFDDTTSTAQKYFSAYNLATQTYLQKDVSFFPNLESPFFDVFSFTASDVYTKNNDSLSGWNPGASKQLQYSFTPFKLGKYPLLKGYTKPSDYKMIFYDDVISSSITDTLLSATQMDIYPAKAVNFKIINTTFNKEVKFAYLTTSSSVTKHIIWFIEDVKGKEKRTWLLQITDELNRKIPAGDTLSLFTYKGLSIYDTIKIKSTPMNVNDIVLPGEYYLSQNYPNPFNPSTSIEFSIPSEQIVSLKIYNLIGQEVANIVNENLTAGIHRYNWTARNLSSGIYFYKLKTGNFSQTKKLIFMK